MFFQSSLRDSFELKSQLECILSPWILTAAGDDRDANSPFGKFYVQLIVKDLAIDSYVIDDFTFFQYHPHLIRNTQIDFYFSKLLAIIANICLFFYLYTMLFQE